MPKRVHGAARAHESLSRNLQFYLVYASAPGAFSEPNNAAGVNIKVTNNYRDESQKNFEVLVQAIGLRAMPIIMNDPVAVPDLSNIENQTSSPSLTGEGFFWKFSVEMPDVFENSKPGGTIGPVGLLVDDLNGVILPNGVKLKTKSDSKNIEFIRQELL